MTYLCSDYFTEWHGQRSTDQIGDRYCQSSSTFLFVLMSLECFWYPDVFTGPLSSELSLPNCRPIVFNIYHNVTHHIIFSYTSCWFSFIHLLLQYPLANRWHNMSITIFLHPSLLPLLIHQSQLCTSITPSLFHSRLKNLPLSQILPLLPSGLPPRTFASTVSSELYSCWFYFFLIFRFWAVRYIKLAISSAFARTSIYVPYRMALVCERLNV